MFSGSIGTELSLVEAEIVLRGQNLYVLHLDPGEARRNVFARGVD